MDPSKRGDPGYRGGFPVRLGKVLPGALERVGPKGLWTEARIRRVWTSAVGAEVAAHAQVGRLRGRALEVWVDNESWATQLRYLGTVVTEKLNTLLGQPVVEEIVVRRASRNRRDVGGP